MRLLITGGAGFVGSSLALRFKADNPSWKVTCLDNLKRKGSELNLPRLKKAGIRFLFGDIRDSSQIKQAGRFELMLECSAEPSVLAGYQSSPEYLTGTNLTGTLNCLEQVRKNRADIVFFSTSRVYPLKPLSAVKLLRRKTRLVLSAIQQIKGLSEQGISEDFPLIGVRSLYGATKLCSELVLQEYLALYKMRGLINRCSVISGPWQMGKVEQGFVALWVARHIFGGSLAYIGYGGEGLQVRDILHVDDLYRLLALQLKRLSSFNGEVYNIGGGNKVSVSLRELTRLCQEITGRKIKIKAVKKERALDIPYYISDCAKARRDFLWQPKICREEIVRQLADWIEKNKRALRPILS